MANETETEQMNQSAGKREADPESGKEESEKRKKIKEILTIFPVILALLLYAVVTYLLIHAILNSGKWPAGYDVMYHIHRGEKVYEAVKQGHFWVRMDASWYNGVEILRYWSPLPAYVMALCIGIAGGNALRGYLVFTGAVYYISALVWLIAGIRRKRPWMGMFLGLFWFFLPHNVMYYFEYGNLAGMLGIACVLPVMICFLGEYLDEPNSGRAIRLSLITALMAMCHSGFALLTMLVCLLWILFRRAFDHRERSGLGAIFIIVLGFLLTGVWFLASRSGVSSVNYSEQLQNSFQSLAATLNPFDRYTSGFAHYYFGLVAFTSAVLGIVLARRKSCRAGFATAVLVCLLTSRSAYRVISKIPGGSFMWTSRMINTALALIFFSLLEWGTLKRLLQALTVVLLALDCVLSFPLIYGDRNNVSVSERLNEEQEATLIREAKQITTQRIALIDGSSLASTGAYLVSDWNGRTDSSFGAGYEAAVTRRNITMLNRAANDGNYLYLFDRTLELGNDTIVIEKSQLYGRGNDSADVISAARKVGYSLIDSNDQFMLFHIATDGNFGIVSHYRGIAIGTAADEITETFPMFQRGDSPDLSSYTYKKLSKYDIVYLNGFTMSDRVFAEKMVKKLADHGTRVYICADGIPEDRRVRAQTFLGVTCNPITFSNGYPEMETKIGTLNMSLFPDGINTWNTVYMNGLDHVLGKVEENKFDLAFFGTKYSKNIVFMGFNLSYFYSLTGDVSAEKLLSYGMDASPDEIPERRVISITLKEDYNKLKIITKENNVDTTIAFHDIFASSSKIWNEHNLTYVNQGTTVIHYRLPHLWDGIAVTAAAAVLLSLQYRRMRKKEQLEKTKSEKESAKV